MGSKTHCAKGICKYCGKPLEAMKLAVSSDRGKERIVRLTCPCVMEKQRQEEQKRKRQGMIQILRDRGFESGRYAGMTFESLRCSHMGRDVIAAVKGYMGSMELNRRNWLYLYGDCGAGKTHLAVALARKIALDRHWEPVFISWAHYLSRVQQSWQDTRVKVDGGLVRESRVLVLDDMDKKDGAQWMLSHLYDIIDYRYMHQLPTIMTANRSIGELCLFWNKSQSGSDLSRAIISRILGQLGKIVPMRAEDFRLAG